MINGEVIWYRFEEAMDMIKNGHSSLVESGFYRSWEPSREKIKDYVRQDEKLEKFPILRFVSQEEYDNHQKHYIRGHRWFPEGKIEYIDEWDDLDDSYVMRWVYNKLDDGTQVVRLLRPGEVEKYIFDANKIFLNKKV